MFGLNLGKLGSVGRAIAAWTPAQLWPLGASSPGMWIDPPYTASMFSTSAGTTAISAIGTVLDTSNPVGLILDRKGGTSASITPVWSVSSGDNISIAGQVITVSGSTTTPRIDGTGLVDGTHAVVTINMTITVGSGYVLYIGTSPSPLVAGVNTVKYAVAGGTLLRIQGPVGAVFVATVTSVTLSTGIHLSQATSAARPVASARKNELLATAVLSTQNVTTTAIPYTISFGGAGTVTASGAHVGALTNGQTFTPTAGTLTLTVAGSVTTAQLERGSAVTSYQRVGATAADYDASAGPTFIRFDGVDDSLASATFAAGTLTSSMDCLIAVRRDSAAATYLISDTVSRGFFEWESGDTNRPDVGAGTPTYLVDGAAITATRGALFTALTAGSWHILEVRGLDLSTWTALNVSALASYRLNGALSPIQLFASGQDANRDKARAQMAAYFGVTLP